MNGFCSSLTGSPFVSGSSPSAYPEMKRNGMRAPSARAAPHMAPPDSLGIIRSLTTSAMVEARDRMTSRPPSPSDAARTV